MKLKRRSWRWLIGVAALAAAEGAVVLAIEVAVTTRRLHFFDLQTGRAIRS